ncbi:MAG: alpha/beta hydrolase, partial [Proteiniphilum sp.]|nr:alpha/beta hydrolase [Proteiniphilum sp.]
TRLGWIEYCSIGQGAPVLFLHGGHSNCKERLCLKGFDREKYQLIIPSRPGYGNTLLDNNRTPREAAALIAGLIKYLGLESVVLYAISAGGPTAIAFAASFPGMTRKLILASAVTKEWLNKNERMYRVASLMFRPAIQGYSWTLIRAMSRLFPSITAKQFYRQFSSVRSHPLEKSDRFELIAALNRYASNEGFMNDINQQGVDEEIACVNCPTLIIHSAHDNSVPIDHALFAKRMIENSRIEILLNEWGHLIWIGSDSEEAFRKIEQFIGE